MSFTIPMLQERSNITVIHTLITRILMFCYSSELINIDPAADIVYAVIRIPKERKAKIRSQFAFLGMSESFIFPDNINVHSEEIKSQICNEG